LEVIKFETNQRQKHPKKWYSKADCRLGGQKTMMTDYPSEGSGEEFKTINPIWASISKAFFEKSSELQGAYPPV
jgi:hypothetical protein